MVLGLTPVEILVQAVKQVRDEFLTILLLPIDIVRRPLFDDLAEPDWIYLGLRVFVPDEFHQFPISSGHFAPAGHGISGV